MTATPCPGMLAPPARVSVPRPCAGALYTSTRETFETHRPTPKALSPQHTGRKPSGATRAFLFRCPAGGLPAAGWGHWPLRGCRTRPRGLSGPGPHNPALSLRPLPSPASILSRVRGSWPRAAPLGQQAPPAQGLGRLGHAWLGPWALGSRRPILAMSASAVRVTVWPTGPDLRGGPLRLPSADTSCLHMQQGAAPQNQAARGSPTQRRRGPSPPPRSQVGATLSPATRALQDTPLYGQGARGVRPLGYGVPGPQWAVLDSAARTRGTELLLRPRGGHQGPGLWPSGCRGKSTQGHGQAAEASPPTVPHYAHSSRECRVPLPRSSRPWGHRPAPGSGSTSTATQVDTTLATSSLWAQAA